MAEGEEVGRHRAVRTRAKACVIRCINGLEVPDSGTVVVEGMNLSDRKVNARALARDVAMVFQSYKPLPRTRPCSRT